MINTMATLVYTKSNENEVIKYGIYVLQVLFMIFSPFWNFYEGYSLINVSYKEIQKQFPSNAGPLIL
jgi:hypothetical protein